MGKPNIVYTYGILLSLFVFVYVMVSQVQPQEERLRKTKLIYSQVLKTGGTARFARLHGKDIRVVRSQKTGQGRGCLGRDLNWGL